MGDFESKVGRCQHDVFIGTKANFLLKNSKKKPPYMINIEKKYLYWKVVHLPTLAFASWII